jgi:hypothetical protein
VVKNFSDVYTPIMSVRPALLQVESDSVIQATNARDAQLGGSESLHRRGAHHLAA